MLLGDERPCAGHRILVVHLEDGDVELRGQTRAENCHATIGYKRPS